ncbi:MAG TPA: cytochrome C oxidase subunit IV family protein [Bryobacteraceae bacterium]|nr:cytochrome C oxidase subunit IV family protein [Bryobacteraceae bacterium]
MEHIEPRKTYYYVFAALIALTALTTAVAYVDLGRFNVAMALGIAVTKMLLVALWFMHVRYSTKLTRLVVAGGLVWLGILIMLSMSDYLTRGLLAVPGR